MAELQPGGHAAQGKAAESPMIPGSHQVFWRNGFSVGVVFPLHRRHQRVFKIQMELAELIDGSAEIPAAALGVEGGGNRDHRLDVALLDHLIQHGFDGPVVHVEIFACRAAPAVHQINDVVAGFGVVCVIAIRQVHIRHLLNVRTIPGVVLRVIYDLFHCARMIGCNCILGGHGCRPSGLGNAVVSGSGGQQCQ